MPSIKTGIKKFFLKISGPQQQGGPGPFQGPSSYPQLCWWSLIFGLASVMPIILMAVLSYNKARMMLVLPPQDVIGSLLYLTAFLLVVGLATAIYLSGTFSNSIIAPVRRMENARVKVEAGDFKAFVPVDTNDELGALAEHFNQMTEGLKERYRLRRSLDLAK